MRSNRADTTLLDGILGFEFFRRIESFGVALQLNEKFDSKFVRIKSGKLCERAILIFDVRKFSFENKAGFAFGRDSCASADDVESESFVIGAAELGQRGRDVVEEDGENGEIVLLGGEEGKTERDGAFEGAFVATEEGGDGHGRRHAVGSVEISGVAKRREESGRESANGKRSLVRQLGSFLDGDFLGVAVVVSCIYGSCHLGERKKARGEFESVDEVVDGSDWGLLAATVQVESEEGDPLESAVDAFHRVLDQVLELSHRILDDVGRR